MAFPWLLSVKSRLFHGTKTRSSLGGYKLILSSLFVWEYLRSSAKNLSLFLQGISKDSKMIGNIWHIPMILHEVFLNGSLNYQTSTISGWLAMNIPPWGRWRCRAFRCRAFCGWCPSPSSLGSPGAPGAAQRGWAEILWQRSGWWGGTSGWYIYGWSW